MRRVETVGKRPPGEIEKPTRGRRLYAVLRDQHVEDNAGVITFVYGDRQSPNSAGGSYRFDPYNLNFVVTTHTTEIDVCCAPIREVPGPLIVGYLPPDRDTKDSRVEEIIDLLEIEEWRKYPVALLPYGIQKRIELGRALAIDPELLLLDEPVVGMNLEETEDTARFILDIREELGISILLVEHDMGLVMDIADRAWWCSISAERSPKGYRLRFRPTLM